MKTEIFFGYLMDNLLTVYYASSVLKPRFRPFSSILWLFLTLVFALSLPTALFLYNSNLRLPYGVIAIFLIITLFYREKLWKLVVFEASYIAIILLANSMVMMISSKLMMLNMLEVVGNAEYDYRTTILQVITFSIIFLLFYCSKKIWNRNSPAPNTNEQSLIIVYTITQTVILGFFVNIYDRFYKVDSWYISIMIFILVCSSIYVGVMFRIIQNNAKKESEIRILKTQAEYSQKHYRELKEHYQGIRKLKHDFNNHIITLNAINRNKESNDLNSYIDELTEMFCETDGYTYCHNPVIDSILYGKIDYAKSKGIEVETNINIPKEITISDVDIGSLMFNLLDNAIEACERVGNPARIKVGITVKSGFLVIVISNSCVAIGDNIFSKKTNKNDKLNHGVGLEIIESIAKKYCGSVYYEIKSNICKMVVTVKYEEIKLHS